ncbi:MAG: aconitate hydratase [Chlamydiales bacterium]|jgi:aconitate hydratase
MTNNQDAMGTLQTLPKRADHFFYSLPALSEKLGTSIERLPVSIRVMLESLLRNCDGIRVSEEDVKSLAEWSPKGAQDKEVPFVVSRVVLQDFTGVPLLVDLAAMRDAVAERKQDPACVEPEVPVDLVIDHSVQVDRSGTEDSFMFNMKMEFDRNKERYEFLKWGQGSFDTFKVVPPGIGIVHQVNLEHIATVVVRKEHSKGQILYLDTLVGTDSHTTMINGLGVVGWGVGGIEAEAAMLGQPVFLQMPEVIGVHISGKMKEGVTATDLTLTMTELLRSQNCVGKFVEFYGEGTASLSLADRATIANMAPEYGATMGYFPVDEKTLAYLRITGRKEEDIEIIKEYLEAQNLFGIPRKGQIDYSQVLEFDLEDLVPCVSGPKRPQDRIELSKLKSRFSQLLSAPIADGGFNLSKDKFESKVCIHSDGVFHPEKTHECNGKSFLEHEKNEPSWSEVEMVTNRPITTSNANPGYTEKTSSDGVLTHGSIVVAAITSCTNTSNPDVMIGAGLLAKKAVERGLTVNPLVKTSLAPGSRVVTDYLEKTDLTKYLDQLGFQLVAYGCTTCIGNSGPLDEVLENAIIEHDLVAASVLSGNRNFEARIHGSIKANFLMSPPLVVAFALAGRVDIDMETEPLGNDSDGNPVFLKDIWPSSAEISETVAKAINPEMFKARYTNFDNDSPLWKEIQSSTGTQYAWSEESTYIQKPPFFKDFSTDLPERPVLQGMRTLGLFGDSVTTDHISPAGRFLKDTPAGQFLIQKGVGERDFNSYGSRRGNDRIMTRGTFANVRIRNEMADGKEGGYTKLNPEGEVMPIYDACKVYNERKIPLIVFAGKDYGMGSSRDWAAKGTSLLGVKVVVAKSFERIHRSNLIGMGVMPLVFEEGGSWEQLGLKGTEIFTLKGLEGTIQTKQKVTLEIQDGDKLREVTLLARLDTPIEVDYYLNGGILPYVLRQILGRQEVVATK